MELNKRLNTKEETEQTNESSHNDLKEHKHLQF